MERWTSGLPLGCVMAPSVAAGLPSILEGSPEQAAQAPGPSERQSPARAGLKKLLKRHTPGLPLPPSAVVYLHPQENEEWKQIVMMKSKKTRVGEEENKMCFRNLCLPCRGLTPGCRVFPPVRRGSWAVVPLITHTEPPDHRPASVAPARVLQLVVPKAGC